MQESFGIYIRLEWLLLWLVLFLSRNNCSKLGVLLTGRHNNAYEYDYISKITSFWYACVLYDYMTNTCMQVCTCKLSFTKYFLTSNRFNDYWQVKWIAKLLYFHYSFVFSSIVQWEIWRIHFNYLLSMRAAYWVYASFASFYGNYWHFSNNLYAYQVNSIRQW